MTTTMQVLNIHVHAGRVWYLANNHDVRWSSRSPEEFLDSGEADGIDRIRVIGASSNARLITQLYDRKQRGLIGSVQVCTPLIGKTERERRKPEALLMRMLLFQRAPSIGGFHEVVEADYRAYSLCVAALKSIAEQNAITAAIIPALRAHPAWRPLSFIQSLDRVSVAGLLSYILDPRWYIDQCAPDRTGKLEAWLGLHPKTQAGVSGGKRRWRYHDRCAVVMNCWKNSRLENDIRERFEINKPVPVEDATLPGVAPCDFVWRAWGSKLGLGSSARAPADPVIADLRASQRFIAFLRHTWLSELYRESDATPERHAALFRPADFFQHPIEVEAYELHQVMTGMI